MLGIFEEYCKPRKGKRCAGGTHVCPGYLEIDKTCFNDLFGVLDMRDVCGHRSVFGNSFYKITREQLQDLMDGKVLADVGEYGTFIILEDEDECSEDDELS